MSLAAVVHTKQDDVDSRHVEEGSYSLMLVPPSMLDLGTWKQGPGFLIDVGLTRTVAYPGHSIWA